MNTERQLRIEAEAARTLLAGLREVVADDGDLAVDSIEGETGLFEAIDAAIAEIDEADLMLAGIKDRIAKLKEREGVTKARRERLRGLIEQSLAMIEPDKPIRRPSATLSLRKLPRALVIESEAEIPSSFFVPQPPPPPVLNKAALIAALASDETIPGASLDNGGVSLTIRRT